MTMQHIYIILTMVILIYFAALSIWYTLTLITSFPELIHRFKEISVGNIIYFIDSQVHVPVTIVVPIFNERNRIIKMLESGLNDDYKDIKFILVNDGSVDDTMALLQQSLELYEVPMVVHQMISTSVVKKHYQSAKYPNVIVLDKEHCPYNCAADAVNAGLNACQTPIFITVDADTVLEPDAIPQMLYTFLLYSHCIVVSGSVYVLNDNEVVHGRLIDPKLPNNFVSATQALEYIRSFSYGRAGLNIFGGALCYPGAFTLFETASLREVGGFDTVNGAYDAEITMKLHQHMRQHKFPHILTHSSSAFCWTEVPGTLKGLWKQRDIWQRGLWRSISLHRGMFFNPKYGIVGLLTFPAFVLFELLGPVVECISYVLLLIAIIFGFISYQPLIWFFILAWGLSAYITMATLFLNFISFNMYKKRQYNFRAIWLVFAEMLWLRQFRALCCTVASIRFFWHRLQKKPL